MPIDLHIGRLVVDGVAMTAAERGVFAESLTLELTRLLRETPPGRLGQGGAVPAASAPAADLRTPFDAHDAATAVARAVHSSLLAGDRDPGRTT
jgi:hypothetical protein